MNRLRQMSIFAHIVDAGSVSAAADKLNVSKSVVSQHLKILEKELGITLMKRTTRRQILTDVGERFYLKCKELNDIADSAWDMITDYQIEPQGRFRITAPNALMESLITPVIADLMKKHPKLKPELICDDQHLDLMAHDIDIAIRVGASQDSNFKQKRIGEFRDVLCGLAGKSTSINDLPYIANIWQSERIVHHFSNLEGDILLYTKEANCMANSFQSCLSLIRSGAGIGIIPDFYFAEMQPPLTNLMPGYRLPLNTVYTLTPFANHVPAIVKTCIHDLESFLACRLSREHP